MPHSSRLKLQCIAVLISLNEGNLAGEEADPKHNYTRHPVSFFQLDFTTQVIT